MNNMYLLFLLALAGTVAVSASDPASIPCCVKRTVGGVNYTLVGENATAISYYNCVSRCVYERDDSQGRIRVCFEKGYLPDFCKNESATISSIESTIEITPGSTAGGKSKKTTGLTIKTATGTTTGVEPATTAGPKTNSTPGSTEVVEPATTAGLITNSTPRSTTGVEPATTGVTTNSTSESSESTEDSATKSATSSAIESTTKTTAGSTEGVDLVTTAGLITKSTKGLTSESTEAIVDTIEAPGNMMKDGPYGGTEGSEWTDGGVVTNGLITGLEIRSGKYVNGIKVQYGSVWGNQHGGTSGGGSLDTVNINDGAKITKITKVEVRYGDNIDALQLFTDDREFGPYGGSGGKAFSANHTGCHLSYLSGRANSNFLVSITLHWECP